MTNYIFQESGFEFDFSGSINAYKADIPAYDGLSAVDFVVETEDEYLFIEVKNPDNIKSRPESQKQLEDLDEMKQYCSKIAGKFKDSLLKELAMGVEFSKPITCIFILQYGKIDARQKSRIYESINGRIPAFKEDIYKSVKCVKFAKLYNKEEFFENHAFNIVET